jgi:hypothetical protein
MIHIYDVIHKSGVDSLHPEWDTLLAFRNTTSQAVTAHITLHDERSGAGIVCPDVVLKPGLAWAGTFIPGNGFDAPPQDFQGHATVECLAAGPFGPIDQSPSILAFVLIAKGWASGVNVPTKKDSVTTADPLLNRFAYAIPYVDDRKGATARLWRTGVSVQNENSRGANCTLTYTIAQTYPEAGQVFSAEFTIPAGHGKRFDMGLGDPAKNVPSLGLPDGLNSEGHVDVQSDVPVLVHLIVASDDYSFMVGESAA